MAWLGITNPGPMTGPLWTKIGAVVLVVGCVVVGMVLKGRIDRRRERQVAFENGVRDADPECEERDPGSLPDGQRPGTPHDSEPVYEVLPAGGDREPDLSVVRDGPASPAAPDAPTAPSPPPGISDY
jgi:hypothetical protein